MRFPILVMMLVWALPSRVAGQASTNVPTLDPVYRSIDKLIAHGLVDVVIVGQRPYSRAEIARIVDEVRGNLSRLEAPLTDPSTPSARRRSLGAQVTAVHRILSDLEREYGAELARVEDDTAPSAGTTRVRPLDRLYVDLTLANSPPRGFVDNGEGEVDAVMNPLLQGREGRNLVDGGTAALETTHWITISDHAAAFARPRFQITRAREGRPDVNEVVLQNLYARFAVGNVRFQIGRDNLVWGQGDRAGLLLSHNARGLDMVNVTSGRPFRLPWVFRHLGYTKWSLFLADLGPNQRFPHSRLLGYKLSFRPTRFLEFGASLVDEFGGEGSPDYSFGKLLADILPFMENIIGPQRFSNKIAGLDLRIRVPQARGLELFAEAMIDDWDLDRLRAMLWQDAGYVAGVAMPRLNNSGSVGMAAEFHHTGIRYYRHYQFRTGWALDQFIIGDNLGPDGNAAYARIDWDVSPRDALVLRGAVERRTADYYVIQYPRWIATVTYPKENRFRVVGSWSGRVAGAVPLRLQTTVGYERVTNFDFVAGANRDNWLAQVAVELDFSQLR